MLYSLVASFTTTTTIEHVHSVKAGCHKAGTPEPPRSAPPAARARPPAWHARPERARAKRGGARGEEEAKKQRGKFDTHHFVSMINYYA